MATTRLHTLLLGGPLCLLIRVLMVYFTSLLKGAFGDSESNFSKAVFYAQPKRERPAVSKIVIKCLHDLSGVCFFIFYFFFSFALFHFMTIGKGTLEQQVEMPFKHFDHHHEIKVFFGLA